MQSLMDIWSFVPDSVKRTMGIGTVNRTTPQQTQKTNQTKNNTGVADWVNTYMKNNPGMQSYISGVSYGAIPSSNNKNQNQNQNLFSSFQQVNQPVSIPMPTFLQQAQQVKPATSGGTTQQKPVSAGTTTAKASAPASASAPKATASKPANVPVQIRQSDGTMKTGYINPADNLTYYDDGTRVSAQTGASAVIKGSTEFKVQGAGTPTPPAGTGGTTGTGTAGGQAAGGATGTGTGTAATSGEAKTPTQTPAKIYLPDGSQVDGYTRGGVTYYMVNGVETRIPTGSVVDVNNKQFQLGETGGTQLDEKQFREFMAGQQANQQIKAATDNLVNFQNRLLAQKEQGILQAERGAEMARGGLQNRMFQDWLSTRQAMTERGLTGSGIAQDANTRLQLAGQQQLAELYTNLSNQINQIESNYQLSNQEKEQQKLDLQNSFFQLRDQISSGMLNEQLAQQKTASEIALNQQKAENDWAQIYGFDRRTGQPTLEAQKFVETQAQNLRRYNIDLSQVTGYIPFKNDKGETVSIPTLDREKFVDSQQQAIANRIAANNQHQANLIANANKATADAYVKKTENIEKGLNNVMDFYKDAYETNMKNYLNIKDNKDADPTEVARYKALAEDSYSKWITAGTQYAEYNDNPSAYVEKVSTPKGTNVEIPLGGGAYYQTSTGKVINK